MSEDEQPSGHLVKVLVWLLVALLGGIGWLSFRHGQSIWHMLGGLALLSLAIWLFRVAQNGD